jgi:CubicO group peptidase (beta-lactamase class C family)
MRLVAALALLGMLAAGTAPPPAIAQAPPAPDLTALDDAARDATAAGEVPGAMIVVGQGARILYRKAWGMRSLVPRAEPLTANTVYDVASLTKVVATLPAVLWLVEQGKVDLDAPLGRYLHEFGAPAFREITVRRVLTHSAGFPDLPSPTAIPRGFPEAAQLLARAGLAYTPGTTFHYSDTGFILLGELVRRVSGERLDQFTRKRFYTPLGTPPSTRPRSGSPASRPPRSWARACSAAPCTMAMRACWAAWPGTRGSSPPPTTSRASAACCCGVAS